MIINRWQSGCQRFLHEKHRAVMLSGACYSRLSKLLGLLGRSGDGSALYAVAAGEFVLVLVELADLVEPVAYAVVAYVHNGKVRCGVYELDLALYQRSLCCLRR